MHSSGRHLRRAAIATALLALASCGSESPEDRLRATIQRGEAAIETRDFAGLGDFVSSRYDDASGRDREQLIDRAHAYLLELGPLYLLSKEQSLELTAPGRAEVTLIVAVASLPFESFSELRQASADVRRVEMSFIEEAGQWKLLAADWRPATLGDVL